MTRSLTMMTGLLLILGVGCGDDDGGDGGIVVRDSGMDTSTADSTPDVAPDVMEDTAPDVTPDVTPDVMEDTGPTEMCVPGVCDLFSNEGCEAGQGCYFGLAEGQAVPAPYCAAAGTGADGTACTMDTECIEGSLCFMGACRDLCCAETRMGCTGGALCTPLVDAMSNEPLPIGVCQVPENCELLAQTGCEEGEGCYLASADGSTVCREAGTGTNGSACGGSDGACAPGFLCVGDPAMCQTLCDPTAENPCSGEDVCAGLTAGGETVEGVGVCATPM